MLFLVGLVIFVIAWIIAANAKFEDYDGKQVSIPRPLVHGVGFTVVFLWTAFFSVTQVGTGQIAVMTRFGKVTGQELSEGIHVKLPIDKANKYDIKVQKEEVKADAASKDLQDVHSTLVLNYALEAGNVDEIHRTLGGNYREKVIDPALQEVFKATTSHFDATNLITDRPAVKARASDLLSKRLSKFGVRVVDVNITNFSFSKEFSQSIESKQVASQNAQRAKFNLEAAKIDAQAQEAQAESLSPLYLQKLFLEKWDGKLPQALGGNFGFLANLLKNGNR